MNIFWLNKFLKGHVENLSKTFDLFFVNASIDRWSFWGGDDWLKTGKEMEAAIDGKNKISKTF